MKYLIYAIIDNIASLLNFKFQSNKRNAIANLLNLIEEKRDIISWHSPLFKATDLIKNLKSALDVDDVDLIIRQEIKNILDELAVEVNFYDPKTDWIKWSEVISGITHSTLDNIRKDELEGLVNVLNTVTTEFDLSPKRALQ